MPVFQMPYFKGEEKLIPREYIQTCKRYGRELPVYCQFGDCGHPQCEEARKLRTKRCAHCNGVFTGGDNYIILPESVEGELVIAHPYCKEVVEDKAKKKEAER